MNTCRNHWIAVTSDVPSSVNQSVSQCHVDKEVVRCCCFFIYIYPGVALERWSSWKRECRLSHGGRQRGKFGDLPDPTHRRPSSRDKRMPRVFCFSVHGTHGAESNFAYYRTMAGPPLQLPILLQGSSQTGFVRRPSPTTLKSLQTPLKPSAPPT